jgi:tetratricopeptide (TPR) repeat protein
MIKQINCPRCQCTIADERRNTSPVVCDNCGFVVSLSESNLRQNLESSVLKAVAGVFAVILIGFMHIATWAGYSLEVIPLKIGQWTHTISNKNMERLAVIGLELKDYDLVEEMYRRLANADSNLYVRLAKFQMARAEYVAATESFRHYFSTGKRNNLDARYDYARALSEAGNIDEAVKHFDFVLGSKPGTRQVTVLQKYVNMLVKAQRFDQARQVIESVRRRDPTAANFMDTEYKVIMERKNSRT